MAGEEADAVARSDRSADDIPVQPGPMSPAELRELEMAAESLRDLRAETRERKEAGRAAAGLGVVIVGFCALTAFASMDALLDEHQGTPAPVLIAALVGHAIVSAAVVFFGYQLVRVAERMYVPRHLMEDVKSVEVLRALLGIKHPSTLLLDQLKTAVGTLASLGIVKPPVDPTKPPAT